MSSKSPPWSDARGVAIGLFVGFGIPLGAQMVSLGLLRLALRFNVVIAFVFTWVNNPISVIPMYYGYYVLGSLLMGKPAVMSAADFRELMAPVLSAQYFWNSVHAFMVLGRGFIDEVVFGRGVNCHTHCHYRVLDRLSCPTSPLRTQSRKAWNHL